MNPAPPTLLVEDDLDGMVVTLGPSRRIVGYRGLVAIVGSIAAGWLIAPTVGPIVAGISSLLGAAAGGAWRVREWVQDEAPLEVRVRPHGVELRRVFMGRLLRREVVPLAWLVGCSTLDGRIVLHGREGRGSWTLVAGFRSREELSWVAGELDRRIREEPASEVDPRLEGLRSRSEATPGLAGPTG